MSSFYTKGNIETNGKIPVKFRYSRNLSLFLWVDMDNIQAWPELLEETPCLRLFLTLKVVVEKILILKEQKWLNMIARDIAVDSV